MTEREIYFFFLGCCVVGFILNLASGHGIVLPIFGCLTIGFMLIKHKF